MSKETEQTPSNPLEAPDMASVCKKWMQNTSEGKAFLKGIEPSEVFMLAESLPGSPLDVNTKPTINLQHALGYFVTEAEAKKAKGNRALAVVSVKRGD